MTAKFADGTLTLSYTLEGSQFVRLDGLVVILLDKATAYQWHAPLIPGKGTFGNFFSVGTNQTSVLLKVFERSMLRLISFLAFSSADRTCCGRLLRPDEPCLL